LDRKVHTFEIGADHSVEALLRHLIKRQKFTVAGIYEEAFQMTEHLLDRGEHTVEVGEIADVGANGETRGSE
jgi:hypothetical protein